MVRAHLVPAVLLLLPLALRAQVVPAPCATTYDACALRLERDQLLRGAPPGERVGRLTFWGATRMTPLVAGSDSALAHAWEFDREYTPAARLSVLSGIAGGILVGLALRDPHDGPTATDWGMLAGAYAALGVGLYAQARMNRAMRAMARAIWWYNRDLAR